MNLPNKPKSKENAVLLHYTHEIIFLCLHSMKLFWKHDMLYVNVNVLLNLEQCAALNKLLDSINPLILIGTIERIKTNKAEAIYPHMLCCLFDGGKDCEYNMVMINNTLVGMLQIALTSKGI